MRDVEATRALLRSVAPLAEGERRTRVLEAIAWPREVEERFFAQRAARLPEVSYAVDRDALRARIADLDAAADRVEGDDPVASWVRANLRSMRDADRLVLAVGTTEFHRVSRELYGSARTRFHGDAERNVDLADHLLERLDVHGWDEAQDEAPEPLGAEDLAAQLRNRLLAELPGMRVEVVVDDRCAAKVLAGMRRVRIRRDARFTPWEADGLWHHEVETHALTAQNGAAQPEVPFLQAGGARATRTQEGLAVFAELHNHCLGVERMQRLARRVKLVDMAEQGADFLDLYRHLLELGLSPRDAYLDAQRVCRGGRVEGGAPFTKDAAYLAGLLEVHAFLSVVVRGGFRDEIELLCCGRITLDDVLPLMELRSMGLLRRPRWIPQWLRRWRTLLPEFAFTSFLDGIALARVRDRYADLIALAEAARPPDGA